MNALCKNRSFNRTYGVIVLIIGLALMVGFPLWSQEQRPEFVGELLGLLAEEGWTAEEVRALATQDVDWGETKGADPEVVALGLKFANSEDEKTELGPMEQALLAIELAQAAIEMEAVGIGELTMARSALEGVRDILIDIQAFRSGDGDLTGEQLGETIRTRMGERVSVAVRENVQYRISEHVQEAQENRPEFLVPDIPSVPVDWPIGRP